MPLERQGAPFSDTPGASLPPLPRPFPCSLVKMQIQTQGSGGGPGTRVSFKLLGEVSTTAGPQAALISKGMSCSGIHILTA